MISNYKNKKILLGFLYGLAAGLGFAVLAWGVDAFGLAQAHAALAWARFLPGLLACLLIGGVAGWLTVRLGSHWAALVVWSVVAMLFTALVLWLPLALHPALIRLFNPNIAALVDYAELDSLAHFRIVGLLVTGLAAIITGLLEINLIEQALLSPNPSTSAVALAVCLVLFGTAGYWTDQLINVNLRESYVTVHRLIDFAADHAGQEVPRDVARKNHLSAVENLGDLVQKRYQLTLLSFDANMGQMEFLVDFEGTPVTCTTIYAQPTDCTRLVKNP